MLIAFGNLRFRLLLVNFDLIYLLLYFFCDYNYLC